MLVSLFQHRSNVGTGPLHPLGFTVPFYTHCSNSGVASWYDLAISIADISLDIGLLKKKAIINPIKASDYLNTVRRRG